MVQPFLVAGTALLQTFLASLPREVRDAPALSAPSQRFTELQSRFAGQVAALWAATITRQQGARHEPIAAPDKSDRRFAASAWREDPYYDFLKQQYLLNARFIADLVEALDVDAHLRRRLRFFARQYVDMTSPSNFAATNPEALQAALASGGASLARGMQNLLADVGRGRISQTDESVFEVGRNLAVTPGSVVFENELIQLIQYRAATPRVRSRPLLMVPPCINKFYVLDLTPENSFVRYAVAQGNTVFMVSWRNPTAAQGHLGWDDYLRDGVLAAIEAARAITRSGKINALGFCVGGTMLGAALGVLAARGVDRVESVTLLASMLDFADTGDLGVFVDEASVRLAEAQIGSGGIKSGRDLAQVFNALRPNDLIWPYVVNNYLKGGRPDAFDILYWNADSTNLPGPYYCWYVRNTYLENNLRVPGRAQMLGIGLDLTRVRIPAYILATRDDHIVPWKSAYLSTALLGGEKRFVLGASGHIAGVVNPAAKNRRSHWIGDTLPGEAAQWLEQAHEVPGSWWSDWDRWLARFGGGERTAPRALGNKRYPPIEPAPGSYVKFRID